MPMPRSLPSQTTDVPGAAISTTPRIQNRMEITKYPIFAVFIGTTERIPNVSFRAKARSFLFAL